jgi:hypothetical protein
MYSFPDNVDEVPDFTACTNDNKCAAAKILHMILLKMRNDVISMNAALIDTFLSLIPMAFQLLYKQGRMMDPNAVFQQCFDRFVIKYGCTFAEDCKTNWMAMAANWHPSMGFEVLTLRLFCGITFANLSGHPVTDKDTINTGICVLNHMGLFPEEYKTWILRGNNTSKTNYFVSFKTFWENAVLLRLPPSLQASRDTAWLQLTTTHWHTCSQMQCQTLVQPMPPPKNPYNQTLPTLRQSKVSFKCSARQLAPASPQKQPRCPQNGCGHGQQCSRNNGGGNGDGNGGGGSYNNGSGGGGYNNGGGSGGYNNGSGGYSGGGGGSNVNRGGGDNGGNYGNYSGNGSNYGNNSGHGGNQIPSGPSAEKR